jgi:cell pole-organizing protein PopZ
MNGHVSLEIEVMSEPEDQTEPEMEEILASIRRIISEDNPADTEEEAEFGPDDEAALATDAEDILDLTRVVNEDGSVVDLNADHAPADTQESPPSVSEPEVDSASQPMSDLESVYASEQEADTREADTREADTRIEPDSGPDAEPGPDLEPVLDPEPMPDPQPEPSAEAMSDIPTKAASGGEKSDSPRPAASAMDTLISAPTVATATSVLADAVKSVTGESAGGQSELAGGNRTLENLVREALLPELKSWLDANLATLVERIVREEIKKMVRRAENQ